MKNIKICFFSGDITRSGGTEKVTATLTNALIEHNVLDINILSIEMSKEVCFFNFDDRVKMKPLLSNKEKKSHISVIKRLRRFIKEEEIDILIDIDTILQIYSVPATMFSKTKLVAWEHFNYYENLGTKLRNWGRRLAARCADAIVTITIEDKGYFQDNLRLRCPIHQIYNPIEIIEYKHTYPENSKIIVSAGRITEQKGFDILVDVAQEVFAKHPDWKWFILGEGKDRKIIEDKIASFNLKENVLLRGNVNNIDEYYKQASMFVLTSRYEGFGLVLTEAKSYGLPCVSFACKAGPKEIILDGNNGFLIESFDIQEMADRITELIEDKDLRVRFSMNSLEDTDKFSIESIVPKWLNLFNELKN